MVAGAPSSVDPSLFEIFARVKRAEDIDYVRDQILATVQQFRDTPVDPAKLDQVRKRLRYESALRMDNSDAIVRSERIKKTLTRKLQLLADVDC